MSLTSVRGDLATQLEADIANVTVYPSPPDVLSVPAIVIGPGDPWIQIETFGTPTAAQVRLNLDVQILMKRAVVEKSFKKLEQMILDVWASVVSGTQSFKLEEVSSPDGAKIGDTEIIECVMQLTTRL